MQPLFCARWSVVEEASGSEIGRFFVAASAARLVAAANWWSTWRSVRWT